jgi:hypothetical protein
MPVKLNSSGGGSVTLDVPVTASTFTATIPAVTGTLVTDAGGSTVQFGAGSASAPSITTTGDTNTGIYFPGADRIGFAEGGVQVGEFDASGNFLFNSGYGSVAVAYGCRAWVNFNGQGTPSIRASGNVSSITDNGVGEYTVNFATAMPNTNYSATADISHWGAVTRLTAVNMDNYFTSAVGILTVGQQTTSWAAYDPSFVSIAVFR